MVVVDSSALIPLARVGRLGLMTESFDEVRTTEEVRDEVVVEGERGADVLRRFLEGVQVHDTPAEAAGTAETEGVAVADASVVLLAADVEEPLLANYRALVELARIHDVEPWWVTTLLIHSTKRGKLTGREATELLSDLVDRGTYLHPRAYARVHDRLLELGDR